MSRKVGTFAQILARLGSGPPIPWSQMERVGHERDWIVAIRSNQQPEPDEASWSKTVQEVADQLAPLGENVLYHDWERGAGSLFRPRLTEAQANAIAAALEARDDLVVQAQPVLAHLTEESCS